MIMVTAGGVHLHKKIHCMNSYDCAVQIGAFISYKSPPKNLFHALSYAPSA
ncbi:hypothetical protein XBKB1_2730004 [Xenorhabdus bovienii str. kraussei Becker Underwood]|uniref:Uncharacterized protein n=1 Tax=Xenorhabdus bovienii str. kraussei Becker Underwood TaxID=1398204 RepID=A0A077PWX0_XENBV|nr:hypothetical protein XBKB1_2730004 [Xenorhabdus bovienii str. kraussei Becker Underwood]